MAGRREVWGSDFYFLLQGPFFYFTLKQSLDKSSFRILKFIVKGYERTHLGFQILHYVCRNTRKEYIVRACVRI